MATRYQNPLVVIVGETGSGKSRLAMDLALKFNGEIISADSWTVRRGLDIGTAKPTKEERNKVPHHLIDVVGPCEEFTAAVYKQMALSAINDVLKRGKLPIMAGGSGLYIDGVIYDFSFLKSGSPDLRKELNKLTIPKLITKIGVLGYDLEGIDKRNKRRLIRLIETAGQRPIKKTLRQNTLLIGMKVDKSGLKQKIKKRVDSMIEAGLEQEVKNLVGKYSWDCEGLKGIGYIEWRDYFEGEQNLQETKAKIVRSTLNLAKRQRTWFKRNESIQWANNPKKVVDIVTTFLNKINV